ncbi:MAG TPA: hypothetical protein VFQ45_18060 [Longimicrobium sp.]|nr:hypothetical protein [Longimicrobium sp.]
MRLVKMLLGAAAVGVVVAAFRDSRTRRWLRPALPGRDGGGADEGAGMLVEESEEPVLGYDGMDRDTLVDWLRESTLDRDTLLRIRRYERINANRQPVLDTVDDLLD